MNDKKYLQVIEWACQLREESEASGRGTCFPTVAECAKRFRVTQKAILEAIDSGDHPKGYHVAYNVAIASGGERSEWKQSEYEIEVWRNNPADLRFDQATADEFRTFWEGQGFEVKQDAVMQCVSRKTENYMWLALTHWFRLGRVELNLLDCPYGEPGNCMDLAEFPIQTTFGEALEILNELANTRAFGGWAKEEGNAEGA